MRSVLSTVAVLCAVVALSSAFSVFSPPRPHSRCSAPNPTKGPEAFIHEVARIIPFRNISNILANHKDDPEVRALVNYTTSDEFKGLFKSLQESPEYRAALKFACKRMYFDYYRYLDLINRALNISGHPHHEHFLSKSVELFSVGAMAELSLESISDEIRAILPLERIKAIYSWHEKHDWYFRQAIRQASSPESRRISEAVAKRPEIKQISQGIQQALNQTALME